MADDARAVSGAPVEPPASRQEAALDPIPNPHPGAGYVARVTCPEFVSLCPATDQPEFAHLVIDYVPGAWLVEPKALRRFLHGFREDGALHEGCTIRIAERIVGAIRPRWLRIAGYWNPRGGIALDVFWQTGEPPPGIWLPPTGVEPYRGRG